MSPYTETFKQLQPEYDPRHIEAYVRIEHSTLDHLSSAALRLEAGIAAECVREGGIEAAEQCAQSFGL